MNGKLKKKDKKEHGVQGLSGAVLEVFTLSVCLAPGTQNHPLRVFFWDGSQYGVPSGDRFRRRHFCYELLKRLYQQIQKKATNFGLSVSGNYLIMVLLNFLQNWDNALEKS